MHRAGISYTTRGFPVLALAGQFFVKDLSLAAAMLMLMVLDMEKEAAKRER